MALVLQITSGTRAGQRAEFTKSVVIVGRHPESDLKFDAQKELDVSTRHAEFRGAASGWTVLDLGSTNGTFINGQRASGPQAIRAGDVVTFGGSGPRVEVVSTGVVNDAAPPKTEMRASTGAARPRTEERIAVAVAAQTNSLRRFVMGLAVVVVAGVAVLVWMNQRSSAQSRDIITKLLAKNDSLIAATKGREAGLDSAAAALRRDREALAQSLKTGGAVTQAQIDALDQRTRGVMSAAGVNWSQMSSKNNAAVAYIIVQAPSDSNFSGTGFCILSSGLIVTNRHVVLDHEGRPPKQIAVKFANTHGFLQARFVGAVDGAPDLAFLQMVDKANFPVVAGIASSSSMTPGEPVAIIGYPLGTDLPMGGEGANAAAVTTLTAGLVSKTLVDNLQLDAFAAEGSSGSPVFNAQGFVVGVVYGGNRDAGGRVVFAVPSAALIANLPPNAQSAVKQ